jgi:hypothetical protein
MPIQCPIELIRVTTDAVIRKNRNILLPESFMMRLLIIICALDIYSDL